MSSVPFWLKPPVALTLEGGTGEELQLMCKRAVWNTGTFKRPMDGLLEVETEEAPVDFDFVSFRVEDSGGFISRGSNDSGFEKVSKGDTATASMNVTIDWTVEFGVSEKNIDAVWKLREKRLADAAVFPIARAYADGIEEAMRECNVVACSECGGDGEIQEGVGYPSSDGGEEWQLACCPACHRNGRSHGWVWQGGGSE